jgi:hypothetical protein
MDELIDTLREAFEDAGYEVGEASVNRKKVRVEVRDPEASAGDLRNITRDTVGADSMLGLNVTTESADNQDVTTVVSFRYRG